MGGVSKTSSPVVWHDQNPTTHSIAMWQRKKRPGHPLRPFLASEKNDRHHLHCLFWARVSNIFPSSWKGPGALSLRSENGELRAVKAGEVRTSFLTKSPPLQGRQDKPRVPRGPRSAQRSPVHISVLVSTSSSPAFRPHGGVAWGRRSGQQHQVRAVCAHIGTSHRGSEAPWVANHAAVFTVTA